jgi:hypothetical protein
MGTRQPRRRREGKICGTATPVANNNQLQLKLFSSLLSLFPP